MKTILKKFPLGVAILFLLGGLNVRAQDKADQLAVIVGKTSSLEAVTTAELQKYFKAEKSKAPDGTKIVIVMQDVGRPERDAALRDIYKMGEAEYGDYFVGQTFTGAVKSAPRSFASPAAVKQYVAETPGAIGYVRASDADDTVKVLKVDGKAPGEADYSLKMK
jgi:ABC-type phosphate transport system substrate-binding protein